MKNREIYLHYRKRAYEEADVLTVFPEIKSIQKL